MTIIRAYIPKLRELKPRTKNGGFDIDKKTFTPFKKIPQEIEGVDLVLDAITAATEAGHLDSDQWVSQVFATPQAFDDFLKELSSKCADCFRIHDRWWQALSALAGWADEDSFVLPEDIADKLVIQAHETGQANSN